MDKKRKSSNHQRKESEKKQRTTKIIRKKIKIAISTYLSIITLNVKRLNVPIKTHRVAGWNFKKIHIHVVYKRLT